MRLAMLHNNRKLKCVFKSLSKALRVTKTLFAALTLHKSRGSLAKKNKRRGAGGGVMSIQIAPNIKTYF